MTLFEFTQKRRYSAISLANRILFIWEKDQITTKEMRWLKMLSVNSKVKNILLRLAKKYGYSGNYIANYPFLDHAATCASAYAALEQIQSTIGQNYVLEH